MRDLANAINIKRVLSPGSVSDNTAQVGQVVDRLGYDSLVYVINIGSIADSDATFTVLLEEDDASDMGTATAVSDDDLHGTEALAAFQYDDDNECRKLGYVGGKRYTRLTITPAGNASAAVFGALAILGHPVYQPTPNPPA